MKSLHQEIESYVESKRSLWSDRTLPVVRTVLRAVAPHINNPHHAFKTLFQSGKRCSKHTIRIYLMVGSAFEREVYGTSKIATFLKSNRSTFRNAYKEKTRKLGREDYLRFTDLYRETNSKMFNLLTLMGEGGLRVSEALSVKWEDFNNGCLKIVGKGDKQRLVPLNIEKLIRNETALIVGSVAYRFLFKRDIKEFTPHDFRAFFATEIANNPELGIKNAAMLLGHSSIQTTQKYVRADLEHCKKMLLGK